MRKFSAKVFYEWEISEPKRIDRTASEQKLHAYYG